MANNPNHMKNLTHFSSTYQPKKAGRKPSYLKKWIKDKNISSQDIRLLLGGILANLKNIDDLKKLLKDPKTPPIILVPIKCLLNDYRFNKMDTYKFLIEYGYGKAVQPLEHSGNMSVDLIDPEARKKRIDELIAKREAKDDQEK